MKAEALHLLPIQPEKSGFRSWKHLHRLLLQHLHQHQLCHAWLWNGNQKLLIARQIKAFQFIVLHHRVEALRPNGCVLQLENTFWHISISFKVLLNLQRLEDRVLLQGALQITTFHRALVYGFVAFGGKAPISTHLYPCCLHMSESPVFPKKYLLICGNFVSPPAKDDPKPPAPPTPQSCPRNASLSGNDLLLNLKKCGTTHCMNISEGCDRTTVKMITS